MPLTFAHPAAAVPLAKPLGRWGVPSALVIGSMVPDLFYLLPLPRASTHSLAGLFWFCLPVGILVYGLFHAALRDPLCALLPASWQRRLGHRELSTASSTRRNRLGVAISILAGALTHIVWDAFTHGDGLGVLVLPILSRLIVTISGYDLFVYKLLQHGSTLVGVVLLASWTARWVGRADPPGAAPLPTFAPRTRVLIAGGLLAGGALIGILLSAEHAPDEMSLGALQPYVGRVARSILQSLACAILLYGAAWHLVRRGGRVVG